MRLKTMLLVGLSGLSLMGIFASPASAASTSRHILTLTGSTYITDDESWPFSDEHCTRSFDDIDSAQLPTDNAGQIDDTNNGCGGEVRIEVHISTVLDSSGNMCVKTGKVLLFEGTSESTNDLDGTVTLANRCIAAGQTKTWTGTVYNTAEGGDKASYTINLMNTIG